MVFITTGTVRKGRTVSVKWSENPWQKMLLPKSMLKKVSSVSDAELIELEASV